MGTGMIKIIDFETQNHPWYGQVASMRNPDNFVVEAGWLDINWGEQLLQTNVRSHRSDTLEESQDTSWFSLEGIEILVAHNAGYEIHVLLQRYRKEFLKFLKRGGRVLCTQYAEYLLTDFQHQYASLEEIAPNYGGTQKVDGIKILWEQGHLTADIDKQLLHDYLTGEEGDIMNTAKVFFGQVQKLQEREQWPMFLERCESLLAFAFAEDAGLKVDLEVAERNLQELIADSEAIRKELEQYVPEDMPPELEFDWSNRWMVSALLFGGARPYTVRGPYEPKKYVKADYYRIEGEKEEYIRVDSYNELCLETFGELPQLVTYARGKNVGQPKVFRLDTTEEKLKNYELTYNFPGLIKIDELPEHLQENFRTGGEWCGSQQQRCGTPVYSTTAEVMEVIAAHGFEAAIKLVELNRFQKEQGTFYIRHEYDAKGEIKKTSGALQYVQPDGIIHHRLNMCATVSGRLSASSPK